MENKVGAIPEFTTDEGVSSIEEVKQTTEEVIAKVETEKETQTEPPAEQKPTGTKSISDDTGDIQMKQIQGLQAEKEKLLTEIQSLRGDRREIKQEQLAKVDDKLDDLKDLHPDDIATIDKVLRAKGYVTKADAQTMLYEATKQEELGKFLVKYPEYKPENDSNDINWNALQRELGYYRMPTDAKQIGKVLERAHKAISKPASERVITENKEKIENSSIASGGNQRSSSKKTLLSSRAKDELLRGGWTEEEIKGLESKLPE